MRCRARRITRMLAQGLPGMAVLVVVASVPASAATWSIEATPNPPGADVSFLTGVSCTTPRSCTAVGQAQTTTTGTSSTLALRRDGSGWELQATPDRAGSAADALLGVSCPTPRACTAVGDFSTTLGLGGTLAERWDGAGWSIQPTPSPGHPRGGSGLTGVSCPTARLCTAVGESTLDPDAGVISTLVERWNGAGWEVEPTSPPPDGGFAGLRGVSCPTPAACVAVGPAFAQRWDGRDWHVQPLPEPADAAFISLAAVSCARPDACTAVGSYNTADAVLPLAERWDGTRWHIQTTPMPLGARYGELRGVSCAGPGTCTAVGVWSTSSASFPVVEGWNGSEWQIEPSPDVPGAIGSALSSVSCAPSRACTAVGSYSTRAGEFTLAESSSRRS